MFSTIFKIIANISWIINYFKIFLKEFLDFWDFKFQGSSGPVQLNAYVVRVR